MGRDEPPAAALKPEVPVPPGLPIMLAQVQGARALRLPPAGAG